MNVLMLLKNKEQVAYLYDTNTLRQGLEKMKAHGYSAIPVLSEDGKYIGCVSEGDFLWHMIDYHENNIKLQEQHKIKNIIRENFNPAVKVDVTMDELLKRAMNQNFIPVTDDRSFFIGIVTRQDIIRNFISKN